ncbi:DUF3105 domain-containing protein [Nocardioides mesophilus]|uniref:DUF3105 domain-containing protein n=1 Tax=Nocardioides mesophilus TaxID=433659 RepID=A0A7G9RDF8_9ACTN|nr:DUF3105 domain-containing protein [Nocardioides mesophilus]QNN53633.1 DUF3105 domain-containing protein [Nocardioides mesophilus]
MAKPSKDKDRRAVVEQMRREQKRAEKKRSYAIIAVCSVVALVIIGMGVYPLLQQNKVAAADLEAIGASAGQAGCQDEITKSAVGNNDHRQVGSDIVYQDAPPAFGPHYPETAGFDRKFFSVGDRPELPYLVHNLEHGYNLLWYDETIADDSGALAEVKAIAKKFEGDKLTDKFIAVPWTKEDGKAFPGGAHIALTHWSVGDPAKQGKAQEGIWKYCDAPSGEVVSTFVEDHPYSDSPEPNAM